MAIKRAILKYGKENFTIRELEKCEISKLNDEIAKHEDEILTLKKVRKCVNCGACAGACPVNAIE